MQDFTLFNDMGEKINGVVQIAVDNIQSGWAGALISTICLSLTVYIFFFGFLILSGKTQQPIADLLWDLFRYAAVVGILSNIGEYTILVSDAVHGLRGFLVGTTDSDNAYAGIDQRIGQVINLYVDSLDKADGITGHLFWVVQAIFMAPLCLGVVGYAVGIVASEISLIALLATFPLFLACYVFGWLKNMFAMWIQALMGCCLFVLFLNIFSKVGIEIADYTNTWVSEHDGTEAFMSCFMYMIAGCISVYGIKLAGELSMGLSQVAIGRVNRAMTKNMVDTAKEQYSKYKASKAE